MLLYISIHGTIYMYCLIFVTNPKIALKGSSVHPSSTGLSSYSGSIGSYELTIKKTVSYLGQ